MWHRDTLQRSAAAKLCAEFQMRMKNDRLHTSCSSPQRSGITHSKCYWLGGKVGKKIRSWSASWSYKWLDLILNWLKFLNFQVLPINDHTKLLALKEIKTQIQNVLTFIKSKVSFLGYFSLLFEYNYCFYI